MYKDLKHAFLSIMTETRPLMWESMTLEERKAYDCKYNPKLRSFENSSFEQMCKTLGGTTEEFNNDPNSPDLFIEKLKEYCKGDVWCTHKEIEEDDDEGEEIILFKRDETGKVTIYPEAYEKE